MVTITSLTVMFEHLNKLRIEFGIGSEYSEFIWI